MLDRENDLSGIEPCPCEKKRISIKTVEKLVLIFSKSPPFL